MRFKNRRSGDKFGPFRFNRNGLVLTSITMKFFWKTLYVWEAKK